MLKKIAALSMGVAAVTLPGGCDDPTAICDYLDALAPYLPAEVVDALELACSFA